MLDLFFKISVIKKKKKKERMKEKEKEKKKISDLPSDLP